MADYFMGLDLGQAQDYTALALVERVEVPTGEWRRDGEPVKVVEYHLRHLERFRLGTPYPAIVERVRELMTSETLAGKTNLVVDATGVGAPVVDLLRQACQAVSAITITGGDTVGREGSEVSLGRLLQDGVVQRQVRHELLQPGVLPLQLL